jgi:iron complex outermembrane receptor protein
MQNQHLRGRKSKRQHTRAIGVAVGAVASLCSAAVLAAEAPAAGSEALEEVTITGSLIKSPNQASSSPIMTVSAGDLQQAGQVALQTVMNQMPQFASTTSAGSGGQGTGGHVTLNMRGLGSNRNLVLLDGHRLPLADISGNVDLNLLPDSIVSSVDTITGGASAVYGSDAMSGVVNFHTIRNFTGITGDVQYGNSFKGDLASKAFSVAAGGSFGEEKGHVLLSLGYTTREGLQGIKRSFFDLVTPSSFIGQGTYVPSGVVGGVGLNLPNQTTVNTLFTGYGSATPVSNTLNLGFNDDGSLFTQTGAKNYKGPTNSGYAIIAGNVRMPVGQQVIAQNPLDRKNVFGKFDYEFSPNIAVYGQVLYVDSSVTTASGGSLTQIGTLTTIPVTNPFIPNDLKTLLASRPSANAPFLWNGRYVGVPYKSWDEHYTTSQFLLGARGDLGAGDWSWDVYASHDETTHLQSNFNAVLKSRVQSLLNAADGGNSICAGGFNPFGVVHSSIISKDCLAYMTTTAHSTEKLAQDDAQAVVQGTVAHLPAGDAKLALLAGYRSNSYVYSPDTELAAGNLEAIAGGQPTRGSYNVSEYAAQVEVPLLADVVAARRLTLGAAYRLSDYSTTGSVNSYEADIKWTPVDGILVRGGYQRAVRAPNIGELFAATSLTQVAFGTPPASIGDPCDVRSTARTGTGGASVRSLCIAQGIPTAIIDTYTFPTTATGGVQHGNSALTPETADTYNLGLSWTSRAVSPLLSSLSASVDYYNIKIDNVISVVQGLTTLSKCYNLDGSNSTYSPTNPYCQLISRDASGQLSLIGLPYLNLGGLKTSGVDMQFGWRPLLSDLGLSSAKGKLTLSTAIAYVLDYEVQQLPNGKWTNYTNTNTIGQPLPRWKALTTVGYETDALSVGLRWRFLGAMADISSVTTPANPGKPVPKYNLFDLYGNYQLTPQFQLRAGITNLMNQGLVVVSSSQTSTDTSTYDPVGRSYYLGVKYKL